MPWSREALRFDNPMPNCFFRSRPFCSSYPRSRESRRDVAGGEKGPHADTIAGSQGPARDVYLARVSISAEQIARIPGFSPTPGMPAEVLVRTRERTFLDYLIKPVTDSMARAFHEQ